MRKTLENVSPARLLDSPLSTAAYLAQQSKDTVVRYQIFQMIRCFLWLRSTPNIPLCVRSS